MERNGCGMVRHVLREREIGGDSREQWSEGGRFHVGVFVCSPG